MKMDFQIYLLYAGAHTKYTLGEQDGFVLKIRMNREE